jgi:ATP-dependent Clp protease adaptor protein ClpS
MVRVRENVAVANAAVAPIEVAPSEAEQPSGEASSAVEVPWVTIVWNDPVNLMSYVTYVFMTYFKYSREKAELLMLDVHQEGRAVVSSGTREAMEIDVTAMHRYGLWATLQRDQ